MNPNDPTDVGTDVSLCTLLTCRISLLCEEFEFQHVVPGIWFDVRRDQSLHLLPTCIVEYLFQIDRAHQF